MYGRLGLRKKDHYLMDQSDIKYILELLGDAITEKNWETVDDARETLREFLDGEELSDDE